MWAANTTATAAAANSFEEDHYYTDCRLKNPNKEYMTNEQIEELLQSDDEDFNYTTWQRLSDNKRCFSGPTNIHERITN